MIKMIKSTEEMGRGLYATRNIPNGTIIDLCELIELNEDETALLNTKSNILSKYTYTFNSVKDCIVLGDGSLYNHSDKPNVYFRLLWIGNRFLMQYVASGNINENDQLFIDYRQDSPSHKVGF